MANRCPKCNCILKSSKKGSTTDTNLLALNFLFGLSKNKKACCDLCGNKLKKK